MPSLLGMEPTKMAASRSLKATSSLSVGTISAERVNSSLLVPVTFVYICILNMINLLKMMDFTVAVVIVPVL